jgi:hydroxyacylglutathione hydrolase
MINAWPIHVLGDNYVWVLHASRGQAVVVVDPGDGESVLASLRARELHPAAVLITHHHADHTGGLGVVVEHFAIPVYGPAGEQIRGVDHPVAGGRTISLDDPAFEIEVLAVPGHTLGHIAYHTSDAVFVGDALFAGGCGRIFEGTPAQMYASLQRLVDLGGQTAVFCAHEYTVANLRFAREVEPANLELARRLDEALMLRRRGEPTVPSTIGLELRTNPFLRCGEVSVIEAAQRHAGSAMTDELEVFTTIRSWKDSWRG